MKKSVVGVVGSHSQAESLVSALQKGGTAVDDISVLFPDKEGTRDFAHEQSTKAPGGAVAGASTGGLLGGGLGLLVGIGALAIPGIGPLIGGGPLMTALSGAAAGAALGGLTGSMIGFGIPELEAKIYEGKVRGGNILIAAHVDDRDATRRVKTLFQRHLAFDVTTTGESTSPKPASEARSNR